MTPDIDIEQILARGPLGDVGRERLALFHGVRYPWRFFKDSFGINRVTPFLYFPCKCTSISCGKWRGAFLFDQPIDPDEDINPDRLFLMTLVSVRLDKFNWHPFNQSESAVRDEYEEWLEHNTP